MGMAWGGHQHFAIPVEDDIPHQDAVAVHPFDFPETQRFVPGLFQHLLRPGIQSRIGLLKLGGKGPRVGQAVGVELPAVQGDPQESNPGEDQIAGKIDVPFFRRVAFPEIQPALIDDPGAVASFAKAGHLAGQTFEVME